MMVASFALLDNAADNGSFPECYGLMVIALGRIISHGLAVVALVRQCLSSSLQ